MLLTSKFDMSGGYGMDAKEIVVTAVTDNLSIVQEFVGGWLDRLDCSMKVHMQIELAVEEIFVNIASYAYKPGVGSAVIKIEQEDPAAVVITFSDHGVPYNPLEKEDPDVTLSAEERKIGGLGIFMVKKSMDDMSYEYKDDMNILRIRKKL
jgi:anti-sigma regulatory factor (Ser/Thr protein kinase)